MRNVIIAAAVLIAAAGGLFAFVQYGYIDRQGPLAADKTIILKRGTGAEAIIDALAQQGVINHPLIFKAAVVANATAHRFKAGEYFFPAGITPREVMTVLAEGRVVVRKITVPEGLTVREISKMLMDEPALEGAIKPVAEGWLLPETYHFTYGDKRQEVMNRMYAAMQMTLNKAWARRKEGLPLNTPLQALTLASIVEKETGIPQERPRVAAVFINRLKKGMALQSDPTVAYAIEAKKGAPMGRALMLTDLKFDSPYNTYLVKGLPPAPIANPGKAAIEGTLNPPDTNELYFVATGNGGHHFSATLKQHNKHVQGYRQVRKSKRQKTN
jgi:UPF0755 protein